MAAGKGLIESESAGDLRERRRPTGRTENDETKNPEEQDLLPSKTHKSVYIVFLSLLFDLLAFTMILPLLPSLLEHYNHNDDSGLYGKLSKGIEYFQNLVGAPEKYNSVLFGGVLGSMFSFLQFLASPIVGGLSDCYGRRPVLLVCLTGIAFSYILWAFSRNFLIFVIARFVGGISKGNISLAMAIISDVSDRKTRGKAMAMVGIAFSLGFICGPMIGAVFAKWSDKTSTNWYFLPAICAFTLAQADLLFVWAKFEESLPKEKRQKQLIDSLRKAVEYVNPISIFKFEAVRGVSNRVKESIQRIGHVYFIYLFIYSGLEFTVTFLMYHHFAFTSMDQARVFLTTGVVMALLQGSVVRRLPERLTKKGAVIGLWLIVPAFIVVGLAETVKMLYVGMILFAISTAFVVTCITTMISQYGNANEKGTILGIFRSLGALARALGPVVASVAFWGFGSKVTYLLGGVALIYPTLLLQLSVFA